MQEEKNSVLFFEFFQANVKQIFCLNSFLYKRIKYNIFFFE